MKLSQAAFATIGLMTAAVCAGCGYGTNSGSLPIVPKVQPSAKQAPRGSSGQSPQLQPVGSGVRAEIGKPPEIAGPTLDGTQIDIAEFKGKVVLVDFWATWCGPCVGELPTVQAVYDKYHDQGFEVIAVSFDRTKEALASFVEARNIPWPQIYFDEEGKRQMNPIGVKYNIEGIPQTFLVDREGRLRKIGVRGRALEPAVVELLGDSAARAAQ